MVVHVSDTLMTGVERLRSLSYLIKIFLFTCDKTVVQFGSTKEFDAYSLL